MKGSKPQSKMRTLMFLSAYFSRHAWKLIAIALLAIISAFANVFGTYMFKPIINDYIVPGNIPGLIASLVLTGGIYLAGALSSLAYSQLMVQVAQQIIFEIRQDLFNKIQKLPMKFLDNRTHGELMSRFTNDIDVLSEGLNNSFTVFIQSIVTTISTVGIMMFLNFKLSLIILATLVIMLLYLRYSSVRSHKYFTQQQECIADLNGFIEERIEGQKVVKVFNHEAKDIEAFGEKNAELQRVSTKAAFRTKMAVPMIVNISYINYAITSGVGAFLAIAGLMDVGTLSAYLVLVRQSAQPMHQISTHLNMILSALSGAEHIYGILEEHEELDEGVITLVPAHWENGTVTEVETFNGHRHMAWKKPDGTLIAVKGDINFDQVTFGYSSKHPVLNNISLFAKPGEKIAFVGSTGAGKTTITNLVNRFYEINKGTITYDGIDIKNIKKDDLRRAISVVLQDTHLFTGTIADNIRYGRQSSTLDEVKAAAKLANAHSFITRLPHGYNTILSEGGENLSQGQRQLLSIARAAITNPPVLILDEATSSIDTYTEQQIELGMDQLMEGRTVLVIAHRLSTVRNSDAIIVLEHGEIIERGNHNLLVDKRGRYYKLYTGQFELS